MSVSNDPGHFFQTSTSLEKQKLRCLKANNTNGSPLVTSSKIITFVLDPESTQSRLPRLFTGESGGLARRVNLEVLLNSGQDKTHMQTRDISHTYKGHKGPVSAVAVNRGTLYTGSWDKSIKVWNVEVIASVKGSLIVVARMSVYSGRTH